MDFFCSLIRLVEEPSLEDGIEVDEAQIDEAQIDEDQIDEDQVDEAQVDEDELDEILGSIFDFIDYFAFTSLT